jgi:hypothetical protein
MILVNAYEVDDDGRETMKETNVDFRLFVPLEEIVRAKRELEAAGRYWVYPGTPVQFLLIKQGR